MTKTAILILSILCLSIQGLSSQKTTLIKNITIISADAEGVKSQLGHVLVEDEKIIYVGEKTPHLSGSYKKVEGKGKFLIPGLIDSHVHLANTAGFNGQLKNKYPALVDAYFEQLPRSYLYHGFTTLIDVNNYAPHRINKINQSALHPDIYTCGNQVQVMDDFMMEMEEYPTNVRYQFQYLRDTYNKGIVFPDSIDLAEHTPKAIISRIREQNGVGVKISYEDAASGLVVSWAQPSKEIMTELVLEAQEKHLPVLLHAPSLEGHQFGLDTGVQIFAHGLWNWNADPKEYETPTLGEEHKNTLLQIAQNQSGYQLTFRALLGEKDLISYSFSTDKNLDHVYPKAYLALLRTKEGQWGRKKIFGRSEFLKRTNPEFYHALRGKYTNDQDSWENAFKIYSHRLNTVARFLEENNANFILGSDTPAMNMFTNPPGYNGYLEMKHMSEAGISLNSIFKAATYNNAKAFHLEQIYGSIEKGKIANLLILNSNPLGKIEAYDDIAKVMIRGKIIKREQLSALSNIK
jgi:imidazolonepropionase-like amidohydrolase